MITTFILFIFTIIFIMSTVRNFDPLPTPNTYDNITLDEIITI